VPIPMRSDNELERLQDDWASDLRLALSPRAAEIYAHHLVADLRSRFIVRQKPAPKARKAKR